MLRHGRTLHLDKYLHHLKLKKHSNNTVIVAVKTVEGQGINMQKDAGAIFCRPTAGDHLEKMKGRVDRPGQKSKELLLVVMVCEHTIEEAKFSNIRLAGNFFREFIAPIATKYRERIDLEATLAAGGTAKLKPGTISGAWKRSLEAFTGSVHWKQRDNPDLLLHFTTPLVHVPPLVPQEILALTTWKKTLRERKGLRQSR